MAKLLAFRNRTGLTVWRARKPERGGNERQALVATFSSGSAWRGKTITTDGQVFILEGRGPISADAVLKYERLGHLDWTWHEMRDLVIGLAAGPERPVAAANRRVDAKPSASRRLRLRRRRAVIVLIIVALDIAVAVYLWYATGTVELSQ